MPIDPYLVFNGDCEEAFKFYAEALGGKIEAMLPHAGTPAEEHVPAEWRSKIMHASITIGGDRLMASDAPPGMYESRRVSPFRCRSRSPRRRSASSRHSPIEGRCACLWRRPSGPNASACWSTDGASPG